MKNYKEILEGSNYTFSSEKSKFDDGYRAKLINPQGKVSYLSGFSYKDENSAEKAAEYYYTLTDKPKAIMDRLMSKYEKQAK